VDAERWHGGKATPPGGSAPGGLPDPWAIREPALDKSLTAERETIFALGNGHLGIRGTLEEATGNATHGVYLNGFHDSYPITYGERAHAYARNHQVMVHVADGTRIDFWLDGEALDLATGTLERHERSLDLRTGLLERRFAWRSPGGQRVEVATRRLVSLVRPSIAAIEYELTVLGGPVAVRVESAIDTRADMTPAADDPRIGSPIPSGFLALVHSEADGPRLATVQRTGGTGMAAVAAADHDVTVTVNGVADHEAPAPAITSRVEDGRVLTSFALAAVPGMRLRIVKRLAYRSTLDGVAEADLVAAARRDLASAGEVGFAGLAAEQATALERFWRDSDVELDGDPALQQGIRFNLFSLYQAAGRDGRTSLPAKGLTGEGYHGHYFWDTEIFAHPFFVYTNPAIARSLLEYRVTTLPKARIRAAEMRQRGALYAWRTIGGEEASAYFPAGTAQYHIDADIAYAMDRYVRVTGDEGLLLDGGAEVILETARLWADLGAYIPSRDGAFCINEVTGPDEYTALVDNNCYTNMMARHHLRLAAALADRLAADQPDAWSTLAAKVGLDAAEPAAWRRAADAMRIVYDEELGIHAQDETFLGKERWDFDGTPPSDYPLLLHVHPLVIYRHQVLKQPDVVLAQVLLSQEVGIAQKKRNFDYYDPLTTGDSSLSPSIQAVAAAELGYHDLAYRYFMQTARMDLDDVNGNVSSGVHIAAMAGSWIAVVFGFAGLRDDGPVPSLAPVLPTAWTRLRFRLLVRGSRVEVDLRRDAVTYRLVDGPSAELRHHGRTVHLARPGDAVEIDLRPKLAAVLVNPAATSDPLTGAVLDDARRLLAECRAASLGTALTLAQVAGADAVRASHIGLVDETVVPDHGWGALSADALLTAADRLGVRAVDCVVIGAGEDGRTSAEGAGMAFACADSRLPTLDELAALVASPRLAHRESADGGLAAGTVQVAGNDATL